MKLPERLSLIRGKLKLTRKELADQLEINVSVLNNMEAPTNKNFPTGAVLFNYLMKFGLNINYILTGKGDMFLKSRSYPKYGVCFGKGDQVRLKSGGPRMTVMNFQAGLVLCTWFDKYKECYGEEFPADALDKLMIKDY